MNVTTVLTGFKRHLAVDPRVRHLGLVSWFCLLLVMSSVLPSGKWVGNNHGVYYVEYVASITYGTNKGPRTVLGIQ